LIGIINEGEKKIGVFAIDIPYEWCNTPYPEYGSSIGEQDVHQLPSPVEDSIKQHTRYKNYNSPMPEEECMSFTYDQYDDENGQHNDESSDKFESRKVIVNIDEKVDGNVDKKDNVDEEVLSEILSIEIARLSAQEPLLQDGLNNLSSASTAVAPENTRRNSLEFNPFHSLTKKPREIFTASIDESFTEGVPNIEAKEPTIMRRVECIHDIDMEGFRNNTINPKIGDFAKKQTSLIDEEEYKLDPDMVSHVSSLDTETQLQKQREQLAADNELLTAANGRSTKEEYKEAFKPVSHYEEYLTSIENLLLPRPLLESLPPKMENRKRYKADGLPPFEFSHTFDVIQGKHHNDVETLLETNEPDLEETHRQSTLLPVDEFCKLKKRSCRILERYDRDLNRLVDRVKAIQTQRSIRLFLQVQNSEVEARSELEDLTTIMKINKEFHIQSLKDLFDDFKHDSRI
jgi:hypothetical protein